MDAITYAKQNSIPLKNIPPSSLSNTLITSAMMQKSRQRVSIKASNEYNSDTMYERVSTFCDADCPRIVYASPYDGYTIMGYVEAQTNLFDKILALNPKQIGVVNEEIEQVFDYGNQLHYLVSKHHIIPIYGEDDNKYPKNPSAPIGDNKLVLQNSLFESKNINVYSYGDLSLNNMVFASLLSGFGITGFEYSYLRKAKAPCLYYNSSSFYSLPFSKKLLDQDLLINLDDTVIPDSVVSASVDDIYFNQFKNEETGSIQSPFFVSIGNGVFNEKLQVDTTHPLWKSNVVRIEKNNHYNQFGTDTSYKPNDDAMSTLDTSLTKIYSWKSCLVVFEKQNPNGSDLFNSNYEYVLLVGIKTKKYKLVEKIDKLFYVHIGDNYISNDKFSKKDIFLLTSSLRTMLKTYNADKVHFFDLSLHPLGNICPNGLIFGIDTPQASRVVDFINNQDMLYVKSYKTIENVYELFESI